MSVKPPLLPGEMLRKLREAAGLSVRQAAKLAGISHTRLGDIEASPGRLGLTLTTMEGLARAYGLPVERISDIALGKAEEGVATTPANPEAMRPLGPLVQLRKIAATAGVRERGAVSEYDVLDIPLVFLEGGKPEDHLLVEVQGDSMTCEDLRKSIPEGSLVIVNTAAEPLNHDIVVCHLFYEGEWFIVLKIFEANGKHVILHSYNDEHKPIVMNGDMYLERIGVYVNHIGPGRSHMRSLNKARTQRG